MILDLLCLEWSSCPMLHIELLANEGGSQFAGLGVDAQDEEDNIICVGC